MVIERSRVRIKPEDIGSEVCSHTLIATWFALTRKCLRRAVTLLRCLIQIPVSRQPVKSCMTLYFKDNWLYVYIKKFVILTAKSLLIFQN